MNHCEGKEPPAPEKPLRSKNLKECCKDPWVADFMEEIALNRQMLYDLCSASNYMDIKQLTELACATVASLVKGEPLEKIQDKLANGPKGNAVGTRAPMKTD